MNYIKLFSSILDSTLWDCDLPTKVVWITMLAMADQDGVVSASVPGLAKRAGVNRQDCERALDHFLSPDPDSRTPDFEGRRVRKVDGGWELLNHAKYRDLQSSEDRKAKAAARTAKWRARNGGGAHSGDVTCDAGDVTVTVGDGRDVTVMPVTKCDVGDYIRSEQIRTDQNKPPERGRAGVLNLESGSQVEPEFATPDSAAVGAPLAASPAVPATLAAPEPSEPVLGHPDAESDPRGDRGVQPSEWRQWWSGWILDYQASVRRARSLPNWTSPSNENRSLEQALAGFCRGPNANPAKVPGWIADSVTRFVEATRDKSAFFGEHGPRGFLKWLNSGGLDVPVQAPAQYKPSPPPPPAWVSPLHANRLGVAKRANLLSMLTSTGTGSEEWERVKMPVLSGDEQSAPDPGELDAALCDLTELESIHEGPAIAVKRRIQKYLDRKAGKAGAA